MSKKVLWSAFIGSRNLGDEAIFTSIIDNLAIDRSNITALSINEEKTQKYGVNTLFAKKFRNLFRGIKECDLMLIGGGGIIQDQSSILNFLYYALQIHLAKRHKKPLFLCFVGVGPIKFSLSKWIMRKLVPKIDYSIVRDEKSRKQLLSFGANKDQVYLAHDPVLNYPVNKSELDNPFAVTKPYAVLSLRRWFFTNPFLPVFITRNLNRLSFFGRRYDEYMSRLAKDLDVYLEKNSQMKIVAVSLYDGEDDIVNQDLAQKMEHSERLLFADNKMDEMRYLSVVEGSDFIIGMRLHSLILGATLEKPFVALRYSTKVDEFTEQMGLKDVSIHVECYDSEALQAGLEYMTENHETYSQQMNQTLKEYQTDNDKAFGVLNQKIDNFLA